MGVGRHLLRRKTLTPFRLWILISVTTILCFAAQAGASESGTDASAPDAPHPGQRAAVRTVRTALPDPEGRPIEEDAAARPDARQGHRGPLVFDIPIPDHPLVERELALLTTPEGRGWIQRSLDRGRPFRGFILERIRELGLPEELIFLPVVESAYRVQAVSRSGATGLWQFMLNSIAPYDIVVDDWQDDRRDFWKATEAGLRKLRDNHQRLGDWYLAIAAYNCGMGTLQRTMAATGIRDFFLLAEGGHLPPETARYVPKFLAVARLASYPGRSGLEVSWEPHTSWIRLRTDLPVRIESLADAAGIPRELLTTANAELRYGVTPPGGNHLVKVPAAYREPAERALAEKDRDLVSVTVHVVRSGDTLYGISRRYGTPLQLIMRFNPSLHPDRLRPGEAVAVPVLKGSIPPVAPPEYPALKSRYTVLPGDTLWGIARRYAIAVEHLAAANSLSLNGTLRPGTVLNVPGTGSETEEPTQ